MNPQLRRHLAATTLTVLTAGFCFSGVARADDRNGTADEVSLATIVKPELVNPANAPEAQAEKVNAENVPARLDLVKVKAAAEIAKRQVTLTKLAATLASRTNDCGSNGVMAGQISSTQTGLATLGSTIAADTDLTKARADYRLIFTDYRVYLLVAPKSSIVTNCDNHMGYANKLKESATKLAAAIANAKTKGKDTTVAEAQLASATAAIDPAVAQDQSAVNSVINLTPDKGDKTVQASNTAALDAAHASEKNADTQLDGARASLRAGFGSLRSQAVVKAPRVARTKVTKVAK